MPKYKTELKGSGAPGDVGNTGFMVIPPLLCNRCLAGQRVFESQDKLLMKLQQLLPAPSFAQPGVWITQQPGHQNNPAAGHLT